MSEYYNKDCKPIKCQHCESTDIKSIVIDITAGTVCEKEYHCTACKTIIGYWAYGAFDPSYTPEYYEQNTVSKIFNHGDND